MAQGDGSEHGDQQQAIASWDLDDRNSNTLCGSMLVQTLAARGLRQAVICPGSRSTPLAVAFAACKTVATLPCLDERSAAFFALGVAKRSRRPVALVCTSGTAGANFYPAVIEAAMTGVPLLILTADRPPELRHCHAGQAIDQLKLFGSYPNWHMEFPIPSPDVEIVRSWRQMTHHAWDRALYPHPGVVHLNLPFREPLAPTRQPELAAQVAQWSLDGTPPPPAPTHAPTAIALPPHPPAEGVIIAGLAEPADPVAYCRAVARLAATLHYPVLAEGLSPLRHHAALNPQLISHYDLILRDRTLAHDLAPRWVIQLGELPTSKILRQWLTATDAPRWILDPRPDNFDPLHGHSHPLHVAIEQINYTTPTLTVSPYLSQWQQAETAARQYLDRTLAATEPLIAAKVPWILAHHLPPQTPILIANSMAVRDVETFWPPSDRGIVPYFNRGANGIDGTLSTALGIAQDHRPTVLLTGDLALLHDTNGFLLTPQFTGSLTIVVVNNDGGGIFEQLAIAAYDPPFTEFFVTPQRVNFAHLCAAYHITYHRITDWDNLAQHLTAPVPPGIRLLEIPTQRRTDAQVRRQWLQNWPGC
ncbi:2-succinyl-5-enolpyruvyl-6-hydroxy-3-cyclohexene-1-carboxylic-acid synthase [Spirulina major]|uniref:2-succinyl-5-enolpyruvyl-6-hydroxy-3- cyclohexene-1-carboxylic-acid synthase n=1 Tax=Spirulina major TaxID=270636 RepID=UPI000935189B|nr:2-succinyl-5-enolpyruvyl-6-hydroxy-3-cyclohexene-1-carboxylic-acid synthase [Spirulina major]